MDGNRKFWIGLALFQVAFGAGVFLLTRAYYLDQGTPTVSGPLPGAVAGDDMVLWPGTPAAGTATELGTPPSVQAPSDDPAVISRQADQAFNSRDFDRALALYERLLTFDASNAEIYNNIGITLHYLGRSDEALRRLEEGIASDPTYQRIWLTAGFVNAQLGNVDAARDALQTAIDAGSDESIRRSAAEMLDGLP